MIKWGIIGIGNIAEKFAEAIEEVDNSKLIAIGSSKKEKLTKFGDKHKIQNIYRFNSYQKLLECREIDAVYIATINTSHYSLIKKAIREKKNILCEKPATINHKELEEIFDLLKNTKLFFAEAYPYRFHLQTKILKDLIEKGEIGKPKTMEIKFGFATSKLLQFFSPRNRLFDSLGGGAILDTGCYCTSFALFIAKLVDQNSDLSKYKLTNVLGTFNRRGVEDFASVKITFENNFEANLETSFRKKMKNNIVINGDKGKIIISNPWFPEKKTFLEVYKESSDYSKEIISRYTSRANVIRESANLIKKKLREENFPLMTWEESINNMKIIDNWKEILKQKKN
jgi:predicted dehydrogenase